MDPALRQSACAGEAKPSWVAQVREKGAEVFRGVGTVFRTGSFLLILAGNIISVIIGLGLGYKIMYLQVGLRLPLFHEGLPLVKKVGMKDESIKLVTTGRQSCPGH